MAPKVKVKKSAKRPVPKPKQPAQRAGRTSTSRLSSKNQLTVPVDILRRVGLEAGDEVEFVVNDAGFIEVLRAPNVNRDLLKLAGKYGELFEGFDLEAERDSWER
jgi:bifunctional DNA-binding transcriptional regulator/antitoxin component of YhaV-PrlF toxin-antitoxin module